MKRHKPGVSFHDPKQTANVTSSDNVPTNDVTDHDPKVKELPQLEYQPLLRLGATFNN